MNNRKKCGISFVVLRDPYSPLERDAEQMYAELESEADFIIEDDFTELPKADGCARVCTYMYNFGAVANNNAQRLAVITDVPFNANCADSIGDLGGIIQPTTLIPA